MTVACYLPGCGQPAAGELHFTVVRLGDESPLMDALLQAFVDSRFPACLEHAQGVPVSSPQPGPHVDNRAN